LHNFEGGTFQWLNNTLAELQQQSKNTKFFIMQHHPFNFDPTGRNPYKNFTFDAEEDAQVQGLLSQYYAPSAFLGVQAGHLHRWFNGRAFTPFTAITADWQGIREFETPASKGWKYDEDFMGSFQVFEFHNNAKSVVPQSSEQLQKQAQEQQQQQEEEEDDVQLTNVHGWWMLPNGTWQLNIVLG
jgi:hypothetical protein